MDPLSALRAANALPVGLPTVDPAKVKASPISTEELKSLGNITTPQIPMGGGVEPGRGFADLLGQMVSEVNDRQTVASETVRGVLSGENVPLHQAMLAMEEASVSFQLMVEVRNKLMESYQELMRMQI